MSQKNLDHTVSNVRIAAHSDIHDIRALTTTGAITLPSPHRLSRESDSTKAD